MTFYCKHFMMMSVLMVSCFCLLSVSYEPAPPQLKQMVRERWEGTTGQVVEGVITNSKDVWKKPYGKLQIKKSLILVTLQMGLYSSHPRSHRL